MKHFSLLGLCMMFAFASSAQMTVVKDVERQLKEESPNYKDALNAIKPALSNAETSGLMMPWYLAGKASRGIYDDVFLKQSLGEQLTDDMRRDAGHGLIDSYNYYFKALRLDSVPDAKGKVKPKKSKEILSVLSVGYAQLRNAGIYLFEARDYAGAYDAWELYGTLPDNPLLGKAAPQSDNDTIVGQIKFFQGISAYSADMYDKAIEKFRQVTKTAYERPEVYRSGMDAARALRDTTALLEFANAGYNKYGTSDIAFIGEIINDKLNHADYVSSYAFVNEAIAATPDENIDVKSQLYDVLGFVYEQEDNLDEAAVNFKKSVELNPGYAKGLFDYGRVIYNKALKLDDSGDGMSRNEEVTKELLQAAELFEKAYSLDEEGMSQIPNILYRLYYRLGAGYEAQADKWKNM